MDKSFRGVIAFGPCKNWVKTKRESQSFTNPSIQTAIFYKEQFLKANLPTAKISIFRECHLSKKFLNIKDNCPQRLIFVPTTNISLWLRKQKKSVLSLQ